MDERMLKEYIDVCKLAEETERELQELERKKVPAIMGKATGSNPEFPFQERGFLMCGEEFSPEEGKKYFGRVIARNEVAAGKRKFITELTPRFTEESLERYMVSRAWIIRDFQRKELVVRFRASVPEMQQSTCLLMVKKLIHNAVASKGQNERIICGLIEGIKARAWSPEDEEVIRVGIPFKDML